MGQSDKFLTKDYSHVDKSPNHSCCIYFSWAFF